MYEVNELIIWLRAEAMRQIDGCKVMASDGVTTCFNPDGVGHYGAMWTRDFCYMVEGFPEGITHDELWRAVEYLIGGVSDDGVAPDRVQMDGQAVYCAGWIDDPIALPATDNSQFLVKLAGHARRILGSNDIFKAHVSTLERVMNTVPRDETGLVFIDPNGPGRSPYGFTDGIKKTGAELFSSILYIEACLEMAGLYEAEGLVDDARRWKDVADIVKGSLSLLWDDEQGMFLAASVCGRQRDVWGSAYAVFTGAASNQQAMAIACWLDENYDKIVFEGMVRHLPEPESWEGLLCDQQPGDYQNGGYWPTPSAWVAETIRLVNPHRSERMMVDLILHMQQRGVNEWERRDGLVRVPDYVASATLPLLWYRSRN